MSSFCGVSQTIEEAIQTGRIGQAVAARVVVHESGDHDQLQQLASALEDAGEPILLILSERVVRACVEQGFILLALFS